MLVIEIVQTNLPSTIKTDDKQLFNRIRFTEEKHVIKQTSLL